jgi:hypothetical protein
MYLEFGMGVLRKMGKVDAQKLGPRGNYGGIDE